MFGFFCLAHQYQWVLPTPPMSLARTDFIVVTVRVLQGPAAPQGMRTQGGFPGKQSTTSPARAHTTVPARRRAARTAPALGISHLPRDRGRMECGSSSVGPMAGQDMAAGGGAGDQSCCVIAGAGTDGPRGAGQQAGWGEPRGIGRDSQRWWCPQGLAVTVDGLQGAGKTSAADLDVARVWHIRNNRLFLS